MNRDNEYTNDTRVQITRPYRMTPHSLAEWLQTLGRAYPDQFITLLEFNYVEQTGETYVEIMTNGERWPGQYTDKLGEGFPMTGAKNVMGGNGPEGSSGKTADGSARGDSDGR